MSDTSSDDTFFGQLAKIEEDLAVAGIDAADASKKAQTAKTEANNAASGIDELKTAIAENKIETATMKERLDNIYTSLVAAEQTGTREELAVEIQADRSAPHGVAVELLQYLRLRGIAQVQMLATGYGDGEVGAFGVSPSGGGR